MPLDTFTSSLGKVYVKTISSRMFERVRFLLCTCATWW